MATIVSMLIEMAFVLQLPTLGGDEEGDGKEVGKVLLRKMPLQNPMVFSVCVVVLEG